MALKFTPTAWDASERSPRDIDPPTRPRYLAVMQPHHKATFLIREYLAGRVGCKDKAESNACRRFLAAWRRIEADGNELNVGIAVMSAKRGCVQFYFNIHGIGPVTWLPVLVTQHDERIGHIMRETGPDRIAVAHSGGAQSDPDEEQRRRIPPKIETVFIPGRIG